MKFAFCRRRAVGPGLAATAVAFLACTAAASPATPASPHLPEGPTSDPAAAQQPAAPPPDIDGALRATREAVRGTTLWLARSVDSWFGDLRFEDGGGGVSHGRLSLSVLKREREPLDHALRLDARWRLPNVERNAYLFVGRDNERDAVADRPAAVSGRERLRIDTAQDRSFFAGVGLTLRELVDFRIGLRSRLRPYAQARLRGASEVWEDGVLGYSQTLFWTAQDQIGSTSTASLEHALTPKVTLRWLVSATVTQREPTARWSSVAGAWYALPAQRVAALEHVIDGRDESGMAAAEVGVRLRWQQPIYRDWLHGEVLVGHFRNRAESGAPRRDTWAVGAGVLMHF
jgi:hypothetical protein